MSTLIPCTVQVLTRNNEASIKKCLDTLTDFAEVIVQGGPSTDRTKEIAMSYPNVRWMDQNPAYLDPDGRITHFSNMRNESIKAAKHDWLFVVDADEGSRSDMASEVREIVERNEPGVYEAFRRFIIDGEPVMHCSAYPAVQIRLFHRSLTEGYGKPVHERLILKPGVATKMLRTELPVPLLPARELEAKYDRYLLMEVKRGGVMPMGRWIKWVLLRNIRSIIGLSLKLGAIWLVPRKGKRMPLSHEWAYIRHSIRTIIHTFPPMAKRQINAAESAVHTS